MGFSSRIALVPYWLCDQPHNLHFSDHRWWLDHLQMFDCIVFVGPYIHDAIWLAEDGRRRISIKTDSLFVDIQEVFKNSLSPLGINPNHVSLYWHVMEVAATCRVVNLQILSCPRICVIGDTHHMNRPITGLYEYLKSETFTHVCCSHNQYNPFFSAVFNLMSIDFPFALSENTSSQISPAAQTSFDHHLYYYGAILSSHHKHRSKIVNSLLVDCRVSNDFLVSSRMGFNQWSQAVQRPHHNLTCSLNGTFSFQTFLPMLGGACLYTDPISKANWVGSQLISEVNCLVYYSSAGLVDSFLRYRGHSPELRLISDSAKSSISQYLKPLCLLRCEWLNGVPEERCLTSGDESLLESRIKSHLTKYGYEETVELIKIFEDVQELHRQQWSISVFIYIHSVLSKQALKMVSSQRVLASMLAILPRCQITLNQQPHIKQETGGEECIIINVFAEGKKILSKTLR